MTRIITSLISLSLLSGTAATLTAQGRDRGLVEMPGRDQRNGPYFSVVLGAGREQCKFETAPCGILDASGNTLPDDGSAWRRATTSPSFEVRLGGTPNATTRIGAEAFGWSADNGPTTERTIGLLGSIQLFPMRREGFYIKGGLGYGWSSVDFHDGSHATDGGFMFNAGAGYDIPVARGVALGPAVDFYQGSYGGKVGEETLTERILFVGLNLTFQSGGRRR